MYFSLKVFRGRFDPKRSYKTVKKSWKKSVDSGDFELSELSLVAFRKRSKTPDAKPIHTTETSTAFPIQVQDRS